MRGIKAHGARIKQRSLCPQLQAQWAKQQLHGGRSACACAASNTAGPSAQDTRGLVGWLRSKGAQVGAVELLYSKDAGSGDVNRELRATAAASPGDCLIMVPKPLQGE